MLSFMWCLFFPEMQNYRESLRAQTQCRQFLLKSLQYLEGLKDPNSCFIWFMLHLTRLSHFIAQEEIPDCAHWNERYKLVWFTVATQRLPYSHTVSLLPCCSRQNLRHHCGMHGPAAIIKFNNNLEQTRQEKDSGESNTYKQSDSPRVMHHHNTTEEIYYFWLLKYQPLTR